MPQYRKLHVSTIDSLDVADMPDDFTRLTWLLLPLIVCSEGRGVDIPHWLMSKLYPLRTDVSPDMVAAAMDWFTQRGMVNRYEANGRPYFYLVNFAKYQGDTRREADSPYPPPPADPEPLMTYKTEPTDMPEQPDLAAVDLLTTNSRVGHELVATNSRSDADAYADANTKAGRDARARARNVTVITQDPGPAIPPPPQEKKQKTKNQSKTAAMSVNVPADFEFPEDPDIKRAQAEMIHAVAEVTGMDAKLNFGVLLQPTLDLVLAGYQPDQIRACYGREAPPGRWGWYRDDWRGKKGDMPTLKNIVETVGGGVAQSAPAVKPEGGTLWLDHIKHFGG